MYETIGNRVLTFEGGKRFVVFITINVSTAKRLTSVLSAFESARTTTASAMFVR